MRQQSESETFAIKNSLFISMLLFFVVFGSYFCKFFDNPWSSNPDSWAQFGGFVGGVVTPLLGLITIWLLAATLRHNIEAMASANSLMEEQKDFALAATLLEFYVHQLEYNRFLLSKTSEHVSGECAKDILSENSQQYIDKKLEIEGVLKREHERLIKKYNS